FVFCNAETSPDTYTLSLHDALPILVAAADAARLHFERRLDVLDRLLEHLERVVAGLFLDRRQAAVHDLLGGAALAVAHQRRDELDRKSTRLNSSHVEISYDVFCLKKKKYYLAASLMNLGRYDEALAELDTAARMEQSQSLYRACKEELEKLIKAGNR